MAISTYKTYLMNSSTESGTYSKLIDIKEFPDLGGSPETIETTTLSDNMQTYINGIQSLDSLEFTANYDVTDYQNLKKHEDQSEWYSVWFGGSGDGKTATPTGDQGKFTFEGQLSVYVNGAGTNEGVEMTITIAPSTPITFTSGATSSSAKSST